MTGSPTASNQELPPPLQEAKQVELNVTIHSIEGCAFLTELGAHLLAASILFPTHISDTMSQLFQPSETVQFEFSETYPIDFFIQSTVNALLANPLEFYLYICTPDMKKQTQVARFTFPFDQLFFHNSYSAAIEGKIIPDGQSVISGEGLKMNIECSWSNPIFEPEVQSNSIIATFNILSINSPPLSMVNCSTQPNNPSTHVFTYTLFSDLPDNQVLLLEDGKFQSTTPDGSDAFVNFNTQQRFFLKPEDIEKWKEAAENDQSIVFYLKPELRALLSPLGITPDMYSGLFGLAEVPLSHFAKPGRSHLQISVPLVRDTEYAERQPGTQLLSPTGFPPEPTPESLKKKLPNKKALGSTRTTNSTTKGNKNSATTSTKKPKALSAKDKKILTQLQSVMQFDDETDYFQQSGTQFKLEIALSRPIIPRPATPASSKTPEEIVKPLPKMHNERLADATQEFCRQLEIAVDKLRDCDMKSDSFGDLKLVIKENLKPSIVEIVRQVFLAKSSEDGNPKPDTQITESFIAELRSFLIANLNKTINMRFDLSFPRAPPIPPEMDVDHITKRIISQSYHKTDDLENLHLRRCVLDPLNPQYPFEFALYYNDIRSPKAMEYFANAISIDYNFTSAILGFCSQLAQSGNREDCVVLLNMLNNRKPNDPTVIVCLSILYHLIESSKSDEYIAKISALSESLPKSPNLIAAASLLEVHDTFMSEIMLSREQRQSTNQQSKDLLILLAQYTQQNGEYSRAQEYLKESLNLEPEDLSLWKLLGEYQYAAKNYDKARVSFEKLLALAEEPDPEICLRLALIEIHQKQYEKAYDLLMYTIQHMEITLAWTCLGVCCMRMGDFTEAEASFSQANEMDKWDATAWGYCGVLCGKMNRHVEGEQAVIWATKLKLRDYRLIQELLELFDESAQGEETRSCLNELRNIQKEDCHDPLESDLLIENNQEESQDQKIEEEEDI